MRQGSVAILLAALVVLNGAAAAGPPDVVAGGYLSPERYPGMELAWREEFNGTELDELRWERAAGAAADGGLQRYDPGQLRIADGYLRIVADQTSPATGRYTSGRLVSRSPQRFVRHRVDIRLALPGGQGLTPLVRLQAAQGSGVDLVEMPGGGGRKDTVQGTLRWRGQGQERYESGSVTLPGDTFTGQFHVFSVVWEETRIRWLADGREYFRFQVPANAFDLAGQDLRIELSLEAGSERAGDPDATTRLPSQLVVDYIRVFR